MNEPNLFSCPWSRKLWRYQRRVRAEAEYVPQRVLHCTQESGTHPKITHALLAGADEWADRLVRWYEYFGFRRKGELKGRLVDLVR